MWVNSPGPRAHRRPSRHLTRAVVCLGLAMAASISPAAASRQAAPSTPSPRGGQAVDARHARSVLRRVSQPARAVRRTGARLARRDQRGRPRGQVGKGGAEGAHRVDAAGGDAPARRGDGSGPRRSLTTALDRAASPNPGRPLLHRLNRAEYGNIIRDLLAIHLDVRSLLPPDDSAFGFDNNADLLTVSPSLLDRYLARPIASARWPSAIRRRLPAPKRSTRRATSRRASSRRGCRSARSVASACAIRSRSTVSTSSAWR